MINNYVEQFRVKEGFFKTRPFQSFGLFIIPSNVNKQDKLTVMASPLEDDQEWWHVSVSLPDRCPTWEEMCKIKNLFMEDKLCIQFHPTENDYVNIHNYCLHLWHNTKVEIKLPPKGMV